MKRTFKDIENEFNKVLEENYINDILEDRPYLFSDVMRNLRETYIRNRIKEFNVYEIGKHAFNNNYSEESKTLNKIDDLNEITRYISDYFNKFSELDRIKELTPMLNLRKTFKPKEEKYFSYYDLKEMFKTKEELIKAIKDKYKKEICIRAFFVKEWGGSLGTNIRSETIEELREFLNRYFKTSIPYKYFYEEPLKEVEENLNRQDKFKIRVFKEWVYISVNDKEEHEKLLNFLIEEELKTGRGGF